ncbi:MAG: hypothetical protein AB7P76_05150 [Candidatus Melainabacteria bacterium]
MTSNDHTSDDYSLSPNLTQSLRAIERVAMPDDMVDRVMNHVLANAGPSASVQPMFRLSTIAASVLAVAVAAGVWLSFNPGQPDQVQTIATVSETGADEADALEDERFIAQLVGVDEMTMDNTLDAGDPIRVIIGF